MPERHAMVRRRRLDFFGLLSEESVHTIGSERNLELIECGNQLFLGDRMRVIRVEIIEDCFQAEISFIDLGEARLDRRWYRRIDADHK